MVGPHLLALADSLATLRARPRLAASTAHLRRHASAIQADLRAAVVAQVPAFTASHDPATLGQLAQHGRQQVDELVRLLDEGITGDFHFVREQARQRAEHRFPLEAMLQAYRCERAVLARWLHEALRAADPSSGAAEAAEFMQGYADAVGTIAAAAYVEQTRQLADVAGDQRAQLLDLLLEGHDESDARAAGILRAAGFLAGRQNFCVVAAQPVDATEMAHPARARRLADSLDQLVPAALARRVIDVRHARVVCVFSGVHRASGWTTPGAPLADRIARALATAGNAVLIGVSSDVTSTSRLPGAHRQALLALGLADRTRRVVAFGAIPWRQWLIHLAGEELQRLLPPWTADFYRADDRLSGALSATLRAYADADMNLLKAAARLEVHPNTVYARLNRIREISGLNARSYHALTDLLTVAEARAGAVPGA